MKTCLIEQLAFHRMNQPEASMEAEGHEYEIEIYIIPANLDEIISKSTGHELQEQWGVFVPKTEANAGSCSIRVRMTQKANEEPEYIFCTKTEGGEQGRKEVEDVVCSGQFEQFRIAADQGLKKMRYFVPSALSDGTQMVFEVDVFRNKSGDVVPWIKIDAEVEPGTKVTIDDLPFEVTDSIVVTPEEKKRNLALRERIGKLYAEFFRSSNELI